MIQLIATFMLLCVTPLLSRAGIAEHYGSSSSTMAIAAQASGNVNDPANNYYAPAINGYSSETTYSFNQSSLIFDINDIDNIVVLNKSNSEKVTPEYGNTDVKYPNAYIFSGHLNTFLIKKLNLKLGLSFYAPVNKLIQSDTGDSFEPNYVFYNSRHERTQFEFNLNYRRKKWSYSIGSFLGLQAAGENKIVTQDSTDPDYPYSSGQMELNVKPSLGLTASVAYKDDNTLSYFNFREEMQSKLQVDAFVQNPIGSASGLVFDFDMRALMYFDPMTLTIGHHFDWRRIKFLTSISYERWSNFESPRLQLIKKTGAAIGSTNQFEELNPRDIIIPRIAITLGGDKRIYHFGYAYRQSPLRNDLSLSGNTIDLDKHIASSGISQNFQFLDQDFMFNVAGQIHFLRSKQVNKTANNEGGTAGSKIGAPGYTAGGQIYAVSVGLSWVNI